MPAKREPAPFYNVKKDADARHAEILIYDEIAGGPWADAFGLVSAKTFVRDLRDLDVDTITVRLNSPGGDVFDGVAIYNALRDHDAHVTTIVDGLAASIASVIMLAGDERHIGAGAQVMIHEPWTLAMGEATDLRKTAELLDGIRESILDVYEARTGSSRDELAAAMGAETWYSAQAALDAGFATAVEDEPEADAVKNIARFDASVAARMHFQHMPERVAAALRGEPTDTPDVAVPAESSAVRNVTEDDESPEHTQRVRELLTAR